MHQREWKNDRTPQIFICLCSWLCEAIPADGVGQLLNRKMKCSSEGTLEGVDSGEKKLVYLGDLPISCAEVA